MTKRKHKEPVLQSRYDELDRKNEESLTGGGVKRIEQQHAKGKLRARERIQLLMDEGTFEELGKFVMHRAKDFGLDKEHYLGDGVVADGRKRDSPGAAAPAAPGFGGRAPQRLAAAYSANCRHACWDRNTRFLWHHAECVVIKWVFSLARLLQWKSGQPLHPQGTQQARPRSTL